MEGLSKTTLAHARRHLAPQFFDGDPTSEKFTDLVNLVMERFYEMSGWRGSDAVYALTVTDNKVTLPYHLDSILKCRIDTDTTDDCPGPPTKIIGQLGYEFLYEGPGKMDETESLANAVIDDGEVATSVPFPTTSAQLTVTISDSDDVGKAVRILGADASGNEIHDAKGAPGERVVFVDPDATTTNTFSAIYGIQKEETTQGRVTITHVSTDLSVLQPSDLLPVYRSYRVMHKDAEQVTALCKRRYVPVVDEEDYIIPGSINALENGMRAIRFDRDGDPGQAEAYWQKAVRSLSGDKTESNGGAMVFPEIHPWGRGVTGIRSIN